MNQGSNLRGKPFFHRSVRYGNRALIHQVLLNEYLLFDTEHDRLEKKNLIGDPGEVASFRYLKRLLDWNARGNLFERQLRQ